MKSDRILHTMTAAGYLLEVLVQNVYNILDCIKELDLICIVISHRLSTIGHFDRIIVINDGKVEEEGTHEHLIHNRGLYSQIYMNECNQRIAMDGFAEQNGCNAE